MQIHAPSPRDEPLTIDIAIVGAAKPDVGARAFQRRARRRRIVRVGRAVGVYRTALAGLAAAAATRPSCLIHAVNPFGFAWQRRFNEDNVDLNRNFLLTDETYAGAPPLAETFRRAMKPSRPRARFGFWTARMAMLALRHGVEFVLGNAAGRAVRLSRLAVLRRRALQQSVQALQHFLPTVLRDAAEVVHLDFHTGLGRWAEASCSYRNRKEWIIVNGGPSISAPAPSRK